MIMTNRQEEEEEYNEEGSLETLGSFLTELNEKRMKLWQY